MKTAKELTPQELTLVIARAEYPDAISYTTIEGGYEANYHNCTYGRGKVRIDHATIGPLLERDKAGVIDSKIEKIKSTYCHSEYNEVNTKRKILDWYKSATLEDEVNALIDYWMPDGVPEEMLR
mgnify:CR=1 FL=1